MLTSINNKLKKILLNKLFFYLILLVTISNLLSYLSMGDYQSIIFFIMISIIGSHYTKNITIVMLISLFFSFLFILMRKKPLLKSNCNKNGSKLIEGLEGTDEDIDDEDIDDEDTDDEDTDDEDTDDEDTDDEDTDDEDTDDEDNEINSPRGVSIVGGRIEAFKGSTLSNPSNFKQKSQEKSTDKELEMKEKKEKRKATSSRIKKTEQKKIEKELPKDLIKLIKKKEKEERTGKKNKKNKAERRKQAKLRRKKRRRALRRMRRRAAKRALLLAQKQEIASQK